MDNFGGVIHWHILVQKESPTHLDSGNHQTITEPEYGVYRLQSRIPSIGIIGAQGEGEGHILEQTSAYEVSSSLTELAPMPEDQLAKTSELAY